MNTSQVDILKQLPPEALATTPALAPPPGIIPNPEHPISRGHLLIVVNSIVAAIMVICYVIRVYTRAIIQRRVAWSDC